MAKVIKYKFVSCEINHGTKENPIFEQILLDKLMECESQAEFDASYHIAEREAVGEIVIEREFDSPEPTLEDAFNVLLGL